MKPKCNQDCRQEKRERERGREGERERGSERERERERDEIFIHILAVLLTVSFLCGLCVGDGGRGATLVSPRWPHLELQELNQTKLMGNLTSGLRGFIVA